MAHDTLWRGNDNELFVESLKFLRTDTSSTGATVTAQVKNGASFVGGTSNAITLSGSSDDYRGVLESTNNLPGAGTRVKAIYTVTTSSGANARFVKEMVVRDREI